MDISLGGMNNPPFWIAREMIRLILRFEQDATVVTLHYPVISLEFCASRKHGCNSLSIKES